MRERRRGAAERDQERRVEVDERRRVTARARHATTRGTSSCRRATRIFAPAGIGEIVVRPCGRELGERRRLAVDDHLAFHAVREAGTRSHRRAARRAGSPEPERPRSGTRRRAPCRCERTGSPSPCACATTAAVIRTIDAIRPPNAAQSKPADSMRGRYRVGRLLLDLGLVVELPLL